VGFKGRRQTFRRFGGATRVGESLPGLLGRLDRKGSLALVRLWRGWAEVVGPEVAQLARPLGRRGSTLILRVDDALAAQELSLFAPQILARVNEFLAEEVFDKVHFELIGSKVPLDGHTQAEEGPPPVRPKRPAGLGGLARTLKRDSPVGRCYRAYLRLFDAAEEKEPRGGRDE
jgi:hypothetical protein